MGSGIAFTSVRRPPEYPGRRRRSGHGGVRDIRADQHADGSHRLHRQAPVLLVILAAPANSSLDHRGVPLGLSPQQLTFGTKAVGTSTFNTLSAPKAAAMASRTAATSRRALKTANAEI